MRQSAAMKLDNISLTQDGRRFVPISLPTGEMGRIIDKRDTEGVKKIKEMLGFDAHIQFVFDPLPYRFRSMEDAVKFSKSAEDGAIDWSLPILPTLKDEHDAHIKNPEWLDAPFEIMCVIVTPKTV